MFKGQFLCSYCYGCCHNLLSLSVLLSFLTHIFFWFYMQSLFPLLKVISFYIYPILITLKLPCSGQKIDINFNIFKVLKKVSHCTINKKKLLFSMNSCKGRKLTNFIGIFSFQEFLMR